MARITGYICEWVTFASRSLVFIALPEYEIVFLELVQESYYLLDLDLSLILVLSQSCSVLDWAGDYDSLDQFRRSLTRVSPFFSTRIETSL